MFQDTLLNLGNSQFSETYHDYMKMPAHAIQSRVKYLNKIYAEEKKRRDSKKY